MLYDKEIEPDELCRYIERHRDSYRLFLTANMVYDACEIARQGSVFLSKCEPITTSIILLASLKHILNNYIHVNERFSLIVATDSRYRPHGRVERIAENCYLIVVGRYLVIDSFLISTTIYDSIFALRKERETDFLQAFSSDLLAKTMMSSYHKYQFPFILSGIYMGENIRCAGIFDSENRLKYGSYCTSLALCMISFIFGHEIGHIFNDDLNPNKTQREHNIYKTMLVNQIDSNESDFYNENKEQIKWYISEYADIHGCECDADLRGLQISMDVAVDLFQNKLVGLAASFLTLKLMSLFDKLHFFFINRKNINDIVSLEDFNRVLFSADIRVPFSSHPWGKTRLSLLPTLYLLMWETANGRTAEERAHENNAVRKIFQGAHSIVDVFEQEVTNIISEAILREGEFSVMLSQENTKIIHYHKGKRSRLYTNSHEAYFSGVWCDWGYVDELDHD